jgi:hypothetical protein
MELEERHRWWKSRGRRELRVLLMTHWDPIGVNGVPEAHDEYDGYLGPLADRLNDGADALSVAEYLAEIQTERMGLSATSNELLEVANCVIDWYSNAMQR